MKLIFSLGNVGAQYSGTRHNVGFQVLDVFASKRSVAFQEKTKFKAMIAEDVVDGEKIVLAKPTTLYNNVGESYRALIDFYKLAQEDTLVIHDELMLPFGTVRLRHGGADAGNNGIKSVNLHGGDKSARIRVGVGAELRQLVGDTDFVLGAFSQNEADALPKIIMTTVTAIEQFVRGDFAATSISHD